MPSIEKTGRTVDKAIEAALQELDLHRDEVEVDILQIESSGILGLFGRKEGRVRVTPIRKGSSNRSSTSARSEPRRKQRSEKKERPRAVKREPAKAKKSAPRKRDKSPEPAAQSETSQTPQRERQFARKEPIPDGQLASFATEVVEKVADSFGISVEVEGAETDRAINLKVVGDGVGQLIGRRGRTLGAVQYMISRLINEDREQRRKINIDVDGYNEDREDALHDLAERTAGRVLHNRKPASLRPMSPPERRVIHLTLQDHLEVATQSFGDEGRRQVVVFPKDLEADEVDRFIKNEMRGGRRGDRGRDQGPRGRGHNGGQRDGNRR